MKETIFNSVEVSEYLHCNVETTRRIIRQGELKASKVGHRYLVRESALNEYLLKKEKR
jgi:excisionase family DNA binding protein